MFKLNIIFLFLFTIFASFLLIIKNHQLSIIIYLQMKVQVVLKKDKERKMSVLNQACDSAAADYSTTGNSLGM